MVHFRWKMDKSCSLQHCTTDSIPKFQILRKQNKNLGLYLKTGILWHRARVLMIDHGFAFTRKSGNSPTCLSGMMVKKICVCVQVCVHVCRGMVQWTSELPNDSVSVDKSQQKISFRIKHVSDDTIYVKFKKHITVTVIVCGCTGWRRHQRHHAHCAPEPEAAGVLGRRRP